MEVETCNWMVILILISNQISMIESLPLDMCSFVMEVQSVGRVPNRARLQIPLQRLSILLHQMLQRKLFG
ncbi:hypothetical protein C5P26_26160 [Escherichia coli]|nr:hypothetical protein C5P26_26160 [Escherichia coli]